MRLLACGRDVIRLVATLAPMPDDARSPADAVRARFDALARDPAAETRFVVGPASARALGYGDADLAAFAGAAVAFAGVGDPLAG